MKRQQASTRHDEQCRTQEQYTSHAERQPMRNTRLACPDTLVVKIRAYHGSHPLTIHTKPTTGSIGTQSHKMLPINPTTSVTARLILPATINALRTMAPISREINLSKNARICTSSDPRTRPADIWRNGENNVLSNKSIEKKSAVAISRSPTRRI